MHRRLNITLPEETLILTSQANRAMSPEKQREFELELSRQRGEELNALMRELLSAPSKNPESKVSLPSSPLASPFTQASSLTLASPFAKVDPGSEALCDPCHVVFSTNRPERE